MKDIIIKMFNLEPDSIEDISYSNCGDQQYWEEVLAYRIREVNGLSRTLLKWKEPISL